MSGKIFVWLLITVLLTTVFPAQAQQQPVKVPRIGYLGNTARSASREAFRQGLRELGYIEGQNIAIEYRYAWPISGNVPTQLQRRDPPD